MSFTRRDLLLGFGASALSSVATARLARSQPTPRRVKLAKASDFGAISDGSTDATGALRHALASGHIIDGGGGRFAIKGDLVARENFKGFVNATLVEVEPTGGRQRVFSVEDADEFVLEGLKVERGGTGAEDADRRDMGKTGGIFLVRCRNFILRGIEVSGGGIGSGLAVIDGSDFTITDAHSHDIWYRLKEIPKDDAIQALFFVRCSSFKLQSCKANDIGGSAGASASHDENRGFALSGCRDFEIKDAQACRLGQGIDISGSLGNFDFRLEKPVMEDCVTWGLKCANSAQRGQVSDGIARRCGIGGFVASGPSEAGIPPEQDLTFERCVAEDVLGSYKGAGSFGFGVLKQKVDPSYPRGVLFRGCAARTTSGRMDFGFRNDVPVMITEGRPNRLINCEATGFTKGFERGFGS